MTRRLLLSLIAGLLGLTGAAPAHADKHDGYKEHRKRLKKQQKEEHEFYKEQRKWEAKEQKRYEEEVRERAKWEREHFKKKGPHRFERGDYYPGQGYPPYGPPFYPGSGRYGLPGNGGYYPGPYSDHACPPDGFEFRFSYPLPRPRDWDRE